MELPLGLLYRTAARPATHINESILSDFNDLRRDLRAIVTPNRLVLRHREAASKDASMPTDVAESCRLPFDKLRAGFRDAGFRAAPQHEDHGVQPVRSSALGVTIHSCP
jgi:hypothetical protein